MLDIIKLYILYARINDSHHQYEMQDTNNEHNENQQILNNMNELRNEVRALRAEIQDIRTGVDRNNRSISNQLSSIMNKIEESEDRITVQISMTRSSAWEG